MADDDGGETNNPRFALTALTALTNAARTKKDATAADVVPGTLREVGLHLLPKSLLVEDALRTFPCPMYFPVLDTETVGTLKRRVRGLTDISIRRMMVVYRGTVLADTATIPTDAFETKHPLSFFEDLYRPKLFLRVFSALSVAREGQDDNDDDSIDDNAAASDGGGDDVDDGGADMYGEEFLEELGEVEGVPQSSVVEESPLLLLDEGQLVKYLKEQTFDLRAELEKLGCEPFYEPLYAAGYADEGAFSHLTPETLAGHNLWLPRKARNRILALAEIVRRRVDRQEEKLLAKLKRLELKRLEEQMRLAAAAAAEGEGAGEGKAADALNVSVSDGEGEGDGVGDGDGDGSQLRAEASTSEVLPPSGESSMALLPPNPPFDPDGVHGGGGGGGTSLPAMGKKGPPSAELQAKIAAIRKAYEVDKDGFYKNYVPPLGTTGQPECCDKHKDAALGFHGQYAVFHARRKETDLRGAIEQADLHLYRNGFLPRSVLRRIAVLNLVKKPTSGFISTSANRKKHRFDTPEAAAAAAAKRGLLETEVDALLDQCIMDAREQSQHLQWAGERERRSRVVSHAWQGQENNPDLDSDGRSITLLHLKEGRGGDGGRPQALDVAPAPAAPRLHIASMTASADMVPMYDSSKFMKLILETIAAKTEEEIEHAHQ